MNSRRLWCWQLHADVSADRAALYSPALGGIGRAFGVGPQAAGQTASVYFLAFAVVW